MEVTLGEICSMQSGSTPKSTYNLFYGGEIPWVTISDFKNSQGDTIYKTQHTLTDEGLEAINRRLFKKNTLLLAMYGSVGKTAMLGVEASTNQAILGINPKDEKVLNIRFLKYWLDHNKDFLYSQGKGAALHNISLTIVQRQKINLPDLETQNKIVTILDKAQGILNKRAKTIQIYNELLKATFIEMFGDPVKNEKGWDMIKLGELGLWKSGGTPPRSNQKYFVGKIPWVTSGELNELYISSTKEHISQDAINSSNAKLIPSNSLLIGMYDTAALKSSINTIPLACNQAIAYSSIDEQKCSVLYVHTAIQLGKEFFKSNQRGVRQQNLNLEMIREISIPKPEISLQLEFVSKYKKLLSYNSKTHAAAEKGQLLLNSLSQEVFSERLTIDIDAELDALINVIDLDKKDEENKIDSLKKDKTFIQRLIDKIQEQDFETSDQYEKAKYIVFKIMKEESDLIKQHFNSTHKKVTLEV